MYLVVKDTPGLRPVAYPGGISGYIRPNLFK
jgi:hypothetical protein